MFTLQLMFQLHFMGNTPKKIPDAQKLSGWQCHRANDVFGTLGHGHVTLITNVSQKLEPLPLSLCWAMPVGIKLTEYQSNFTKLKTKQSLLSYTCNNCAPYGYESLQFPRGGEGTNIADV